MTWTTRADIGPPIIANGGPPGLIFGLIVAFFYYSFVGLGLAEVCGNLPF